MFLLAAAFQSSLYAFEMRVALKSLSALGLCLLIAVTWQAMAMTPGAPAVAGQMVICTGAGPVTVYMDAQGNPVQHVHHCPDCIVDFANPDLASLPLRVARLLDAALSVPAPAARVPASAIHAYLSRAPPVLV